MVVAEWAETVIDLSLKLRFASKIMFDMNAR